MTTSIRKPLALVASLGLVLVGALSACSSDDGASVEDFCAEGESALSGDALDAIDPTDSDALHAGIADMAKKAKEIKAPDEIKDDWATLVSAFDTMASDIKGLDLTDPDDQKKFTESLSVMTEGEVGAAQENVSTFVEENCTTSK